MTCFYFTIYVFTDEVSFPLSCLAFITANQVGTGIPSPGGIGGVELALSGALRLSVSASIALLPLSIMCYFLIRAFHSV